MGPETEIRSPIKIEQNEIAHEDEQKHEDINLKNDDLKFKSHEEKLKSDAHNLKELLGSVTTSNCPGVRTSARVIQKMKQDSIRPVTPPPEKKDPAKDEKVLPKTPSQSKTGKVIWSNIERNLFFDAINEFGKDFEAIANFINMKFKRKNTMDQPSKTKEQIRQLYYQTFHKISKYIKFSEDVKKPAQELYGLINYGEMRRKLIFVSEKNCMKIRDLVYKGCVTVRSKGKNVRIKTPSCKALRKLNQLEDWQDDIKLPSKVEVRLRPANMESWGKVQNIAQNPVVRTVVPLQKKLVNIISTFQHKWRSQEAKVNEQAIKIIRATTTSTSSKTEPENLKCSEPLICMTPSPSVSIHRPLVNLSEFLNNFNICLNSYEQKIGVKVRGETLWHDRPINKRQRSDSGCEKKSPEGKRFKNENDMRPLDSIGTNIYDTPDKDDKEIKSDISEVSNSNDLPEELQEIFSESINIERHHDDGNEYEITKSELFSNNSDNAKCGFPPEKDNDSQNIDKCTVLLLKDEEQQIIAAQKSQADTKHRKKESKHSSSKKKDKKIPTNTKPLLNDGVINDIRRGWTIHNAGDIVIGDLYIMFGENSKVLLEYYWLSTEKDGETESAPKKSVVPYNINNNDNIVSTCLNNIRDSSLGNKLRHLLMIANLSDRIKKKQCNCGHTCEKGWRLKKFDLDPVTKSFVSNKTYTSSNSDYGVFRQPSTPFRRNFLPSESYRPLHNGLRLKQTKLSKGKSIPSKKVIVQRLLPVQPGVNQSFDVVTSPVQFNKLTNNQTDDDDDDIQNTDNTTLLLKEDEEKEEAEDEEEGEEQNKSYENLIPKIGQPDMTKISDDEPIVGIKDMNSLIDESVVETNNIPNLVKQQKYEEKTVKTDIINDKELETSEEINLNQDPGIKQLMEISLPSPARIASLEDGDSLGSIQPMSPMRLLRDCPSDSKWFEENLNDFSLSSFLGHLDDMPNDNSNLSVINETSIDYVSKFADLTASIETEDKDSLNNVNFKPL